jgi:anti-anti-sigma factor
MSESPKYFDKTLVEGVPEICLGSADFVSRPNIILALEELIDYINAEKPEKLLINFKRVRHISSEFITAMIRVNEHVVANGGSMKLTHMNDSVLQPFKITNLAGSVFHIYESTPQAIDAF